MRTIHGLYALCAASSALAATPAFAKAVDAPADTSVSLGVTGGTLGIGPEVTWRASPVLSLRANATWMAASHGVDGDDIRYHGHLDLNSYGLMADLHPFRNGFRISGGVRLSGNKIDLRGKAADGDVVSIGGQDYTGAEIGTLTGKVEANDVAPTLTIGYAANATRGLKFGAELGAMFMGRPRVNDLTGTGIAMQDPDFAQDLANEERDIEDDIGDYRVYPILQVSLSYAF
ncbi:hypothetical protein HT136_00480 [Novosphingobium profundi]|uniref:hypothetical protein n=1 Tax=Novosphingobium profundi TaxID=1774954 RepID=UPI001BDA86D4|nr:hypothetical protein [Novosphingobium profundi]MBT0666843.1 hypothetical protein [Novosphingobium profundi]